MTVSGKKFLEKISFFGNRFQTPTKVANMAVILLEGDTGISKGQQLGT
jgi:hypothetical protein